MIVGCLLASPAIAQDEHVHIRALTDFADYHPGDSGLLALEIKIDEDWHIYWPGVSDSGFGISLDLRSSGPLTLDDPIWPTPKRHILPGEILDHVYEDTVMVLVPFQINADAEPELPIFFDVDAEFLVCSSICLPGKANASTSASVVDETVNKDQTPDHDTITSAYQHRPRRFNPNAQDVRVQWIADAAAIMFRDATKIEFFPSKECTTLANPIADGTTNSNRLVIKFSQRTNKVLFGRIRSYEPAGPVDYDINIRPPESSQGTHP